MSTITVKELAAPTGYDLKIASGETLDLKSQGTVTMPTGSVLSVTVVEDATAQSTSSTSYVDTGLTVTITPKSTSSKFYCQWTMQGQFENGNDGIGVRLERAISGGATTNAFTSTQPYHLYTANTAHAFRLMGSWHHLDSPATASAITYTVQVATTAASAVGLNDANNQTHLVVTEVQG